VGGRQVSRHGAGPAKWTLSNTAIERIEKIRDGGNLTFYPDFQYALFSTGTAMPDWRQLAGRS
jgi:hypothetical protein